MSDQTERSEQAKRSMKRLTSLVANGQHPEDGKAALWYLLGQFENELKKLSAKADDELLLEEHMSSPAGQETREALDAALQREPVIVDDCDSHLYRRAWTKHVVAAARESTCSKSQRGAVIIKDVGLEGYDGYVVARGWNGPPDPFICGGEVCALACNKLAVHAEERALLAAGLGAAYGHMIHIKLVDGEPVPSGPPSCWQCSRAILKAHIAKVWLLHEEGWKGYTAIDFHNQTLKNCDLPVFRSDK